MPELRKNANLEYNPDSIYNASKKLSVIALKNLENSGENPDLANSNKDVGDLKGYYEDFLGEIVNISTNYKQLQSFIYEFIDTIKRFEYDEYDDMSLEEQKLYDAWKVMGFDVEGALQYYSAEKNFVSPSINLFDNKRTKQYGTVKGSGKLKKGGAFKSSVKMPRFTKKFEGRPEPTSWAEANFNGEILRGGADRSVSTYGSLSPIRLPTMWANMGDNDGGDDGGDDDGSSSGSEEAEYISGSDSDDETLTHAQTSYSGNNASTVASALSEDPLEQWDEGNDIILHDLQTTYVKPNSVIFIISKLISLISKANILFNGRIKKNINYFEKLDIQDMADKVEKIVELHDDTPLEVISISVSNGDELVRSLKSALDKLYNDVAIAIKSYSSKRQQGGSRRSPKIVYQGSGISNINMNPLKKYQNIPKKYLL